MNQVMKSNLIEGFPPYLRDKFTLRSKHCQSTICGDNHNFFPRYTIVATNIKTTLSTSYTQHVFFRDMRNSIFSSSETNVQ